MAARTENGSEVLEYLLKNGAGVNIKGPEASPVLHLAARSGNETVVKKLDFPSQILSPPVPTNQHSPPCFGLLAGRVSYVYIPGQGK